MRIAELKKWFAKRELPNELQVNDWTKITDVKFCVESLIKTLEAHRRQKAYLPYYEQLLEIKQKLENQ